MTPTLNTFVRALQTPDLSFKTLSAARAVVGEDSLPLITRTTRFAEAQIDLRGERWLVFLPLTPAALPRIERTASALRRLTTDFLTEYRILPGELMWQDDTGRDHSCDLIIQYLPAGRDFRDALLYEHKDTLLAALDTLQKGLREAGFTHNNLKSENLRWCAGRFVPLRYHNAHIGDGGSDDEAFEALRHDICAAADTQTVGDQSVSYAPATRLKGHKWTSNVFEGLICVEDEAGYGFVDTDNRTVIPARFVWAGDFREGRAEVQTTEGMGLIDREGRFIIPAQYEIVDYDPAESIARVRQNGRWALFDYLGRRLTEFGTKCECV